MELHIDHIGSCHAAYGAGGLFSDSVLMVSTNTAVGQFLIETLAMTSKLFCIEYSIVRVFNADARFCLMFQDELKADGFGSIQ